MLKPRLKEEERIKKIEKITLDKYRYLLDN